MSAGLTLRNFYFRLYRGAIGELEVIDFLKALVRHIDRPLLIVWDYYPQSNGKLERWHQSLKSECIRPGVPLTPEDARRLIERYVVHYNTVRLHSAIGYVTPLDMLTGRQAQIHAARDRKLEHARRQRQLRRQQAA